MEERSTLYSYAIVAQPIHAKESKRYLWQKCGKYKLLKSAQEALKNFTSDTVANNLYRIIPYFEGYYWTDLETEKALYRKTNSLLWDYLAEKGLFDDAQKYLLSKNKDIEKEIFF